VLLKRIFSYPSCYVLDWNCEHPWFGKPTMFPVLMPWPKMANFFILKVRLSINI
jgi:hypothetical protein